MTQNIKKPLNDYYSDSVSFFGDMAFFPVSKEEGYARLELKSRSQLLHELTMSEYYKLQKYWTYLAKNIDGDPRDFFNI